ncbi:MAG: nucleotide exchange factor GrpE [Bacteriovoracaceae bacterium]|nr:nucleotide exchange factor GrpE [Bacteriovoracaceae bacterium]
MTEVATENKVDEKETGEQETSKDQKEENDETVKEMKKDKKKLKEEKKIKKEEEKEDYKSKYFYLAAELDNQRKRMHREKENLIKYGNEKILRSLIEVMDNFDHTIDALQDEVDEKSKNIMTGVAMIRKQFLDVLDKNGLESIESIGKMFDPNFHEAMAGQPVPDKKEGEVITEYRKGYILNGRLLRPSRVIVAKALEENKKDK